ncbi:angiopoietin-1 receptor-like [Asterias amurensis]|uniref:angiopoietin-1 receptor-like n=1 Tax=Asterias amurensis TaxID=7602 RepID=UPI003AB5ADD9
MEVLDTCNRVVSYFLITVIVFSSCYLGVFAVDDFTCVTKPRVPLDAEDTFIAGFFVNLAGSLSIRRTQFTYTTPGDYNPNDRSLPTGSIQDPTALHGDVSVSVLRMPASGGISRIGVYGCQATVTGQSTYNIGTVIMSSTADYLPTDISQTVNLGETVRLTVNATTGQQLTRWRKDSSDVIRWSNDILYYDINGASYTDAGTYEVHFRAPRFEGRQALMRLLVTGCQQDRWGTSCSGICPVCFNGGVCDDVGGLCICPPGFSGDICEIVLGPNRFGKDGSLYCNSGVLPDTTSCEGLLFCLPDPFGCICGAGYKGIDCKTECDDGTFGANCAQMCHCSGNTTCNKTIGRCPGNCASGYKGINCQDDCGAGLGGLNCSTSCEVPAVATLFRDVAPPTPSPQIQLVWKFVSNLCAVERYQIEYELTNQDQCQAITSQRVVATSDLYADSLIISGGLQPFSSYTVYIKAWNEIGAGQETSVSVTTGESAPSGPPRDITSTVVTNTTLSFSWDQPECGSRHGVITQYSYTLTSTDDGAVIRNNNVLSASLDLTGLIPSTHYTLSVAAGNSFGLGPVAVKILRTDEGTKLPSTTPSILIIVICVVIAAAVIVVGVICYTRRRCKRRRRNPLKHPGINAGHELVSYENAEPIEEKPTSAPTQRGVSLVQESVYEPVGPGSSARRDALPAPSPSPAPAPAPPPAPESQPTYEDVGLPTWANPWSILWEDLFIGNKVLGKGHFGEVRYGVVTVKGDLCKAAIKTLKENATYIDRENFLEELKTMTLHGSHPNLVKILGACQHEGILYVAMEYLSNGDLRCYLRKARSMEDDGQASLSPKKLLQFALDVAKGMQHLAAHGVIHRDLAARNILLDDNLNAKVSDFGLSRGEDVYVQTSKTRVPTRWLSLESLTHQTYTSKSDVWSFGILLWEIATLGGTPYPGIKTPFLTSRLENGYRMPKPDNSDDNIYEVMLQCWQEDPNGRPSFKKLVSDLETMADSKEDQIYMRLLTSSEKYLYVNIHPELDDN